VSLGCGLAVSARPELMAKLPAIVGEIFGSGISTGAIVAVVLNLVLPGREAEAHDDETEQEEPPQPLLVKNVEAA
jgi:NCS2 family nucleobase:cation symporter-2